MASAFATRTSDTTIVLATRTMEHSVDASKHLKTVLSTMSTHRTEWSTAMYPTPPYPTSNGQSNAWTDSSKHREGSRDVGTSYASSEFVGENSNSMNVSSNKLDEDRKIESTEQRSTIDQTLHPDVVDQHEMPSNRIGELPEEYASSEFVGENSDSINISSYKLDEDRQIESTEQRSTIDQTLHPDAVDRHEMPSNRIEELPEEHSKAITDVELPSLLENETLKLFKNETGEPFSNSTFIRSSDAVKDPLLTNSGNNLATDEERYQGLREGKPVPASRIGRAAGFAALGVGIAMGTAAEYAARLLGSSANSSSSAVVNDANADRLAATLCRMRGAALKMGQMLSIQDESLLPPALTRALKQVRQGADAMPKHQLIAQLKSQLGDNWRDKFVSFDEVPFAAASIGQVHKATIRDSNSGVIKPAVVKVQFPGVANSIASDLNNLKMLVQMTGLAPRGLFIENVIRVGREELRVECDYLREMENQKRFKQLVENDPVLHREKFCVPDVFPGLTSTQVITSEYAPGGTIDKVSHLSQEERNRIGRYIMYLTIQELFVWRFMQTDPNWGNFLFDVGTGKTYLVDFGAAREYSKDFVDGYLRIVWASANRDETTLLDQSHRMKFLLGDENDLMLHAHKQSGFTVAEPFLKNEPFDFRGSNISSRMSEHTSVFLQHRLT